MQESLALIGIGIAVLWAIAASIFGIAWGLNLCLTLWQERHERDQQYRLHAVLMELRSLHRGSHPQVADTADFLLPLAGGPGGYDIHNFHKRMTRLYPPVQGSHTRTPIHDTL